MTSTAAGRDAARESGEVQCQVCCGTTSVDDAIVVWRDDAVAFAICHACTGAHDIVLRPPTAVGASVQVLAKSRGGKPVPAQATPYERVPAVATRRIGPPAQNLVAAPPRLVRVA